LAQTFNTTFLVASPYVMSVSYNFPVTYIGALTATANRTTINFGDGSPTQNCSADLGLYPGSPYTFYVCPSYKYSTSQTTSFRTITYTALQGPSSVGTTTISINVTNVVGCLALPYIGNFVPQFNLYIVEAGATVNNFELSIINPIDTTTYITGIVNWGDGTAVTNFNSSVGQPFVGLPSHQFVVSSGNTVDVTLSTGTVVGTTPSTSTSRCANGGPLNAIVRVSKLPIFLPGLPSSITVTASNGNITTINVGTLFTDRLRYQINGGAFTNCTTVIARSSYQCVIDVSGQTTPITITLDAFNAPWSTTANYNLSVTVSSQTPTGSTVEQRPYNSAVRKPNISQYCNAVKYPGVTPKSASGFCAN